MRDLPSVCRRLILWCLPFCATISFACERIPAGQAIFIRLTSPISSYSAKLGDPVHAIITEDVACGDQVMFPVGAVIEGSVHSVRKVGWGLRHETAALQLEFHTVSANDGGPSRITATVVEVENAREQVSNGVVQGIRSTYTPQGRITSRLKYLPTLNPYPDMGLLIFKATFPIFPEPEIYLPAGTDMQLRLKEAVLNPVVPTNSLRVPQLAPEQKAELEYFVRSLPQRSTTQTLASADLVNLVFVGSPQQLQSAFENAGWATSDQVNKHSFFRNFYAVLNNSGYAQEPMRPFLLEGNQSAMNWQKSLNSYARRDHLRIWQWSEPLGTETVWLSSSTRDTGASLSLKYREFVHHINPAIDEERSKVIRDLRAAGCVQSVYLVPRRNVANITQNATGDTVRTDAAIAIVQMQDCRPVAPELASSSTTVPFKPGNIVFRYFRRSILTFRSDIWRANIIYAAYDLGRMGVGAIRHHPSLTPLPSTEASVSLPTVKSFE